MTNKRLCWLYFLWVPLGLAVVAGIIAGSCHALAVPVDEAAIDAYRSFLDSALIFVLVVRCYHHVMADDYRSAEKSKTAFLKKVLLFYAISFLAGELSGWLVDFIAPDAAWFNESLLSQYREKLFVPLSWLKSCLFAPVTEEIVFRYILQNGIKSKPWNILIVSLIFGFVHAFFGAEIIVYTVSGLCLGVAYEKTGDINVPICVHMLNNIVAMLP